MTEKESQHLWFYCYCGENRTKFQYATTDADNCRTVHE
uniref:Uncharacterized protein n=1 Tax=Anguilla anguilla TaxID=7936 RepID=A0A0E9U286_ANGAN